MNAFTDLIRILEGLLVLTGIAGIVFALFKSATTKATIISQKQLIETLSTEVSELRQLYIDNEKAIAELKGQVSIYKELPLAEMAKNMKSMSRDQALILKMLKNGDTSLD